MAACCRRCWARSAPPGCCHVHVHHVCPVAPHLEGVSLLRQTLPDFGGPAGLAGGSCALAPGTAAHPPAVPAPGVAPACMDPPTGAPLQGACVHPVSLTVRAPAPPLCRVYVCNDNLVPCGVVTLTDILHKLVDA